MRTAYRSLSYAIVVLVFVQAASIAWAYFGLGKWVSDGGVLNKAKMEEESGPLLFPEVAGFIIHGITGALVIPLVAVLMLIVAFFAAVPRGVMFGAVTVVLVALQAFVLPELANGVPFFGAVHGLNALFILGVAFAAARAAAGAHEGEHVTTQGGVRAEG